MIRYTLRLHGPGVRGTRISAVLLRDLLEILAEGTRGSLRLRVEGRSTARGTTPQWLVTGADFDLVAIEDGSTVMVFEAPALGDVSGGPLDQGDLFPPLDPTLASLTLVQDSLEEALEGKADSELFDEALLDRFQGFERVFAKGVELVEIADGRRGGRTVRVEPGKLQALERLRRSTPPPQRVRVAGWLDQIRHSDRMFTLKVESGKILRGFAEGVDPERMATLFGKKAVVSGNAVFRPSGKVLRLEADQIEPAGTDFSVWSTEPKPVWGGESQTLRQTQGTRSGVNAVIGQWPGEENDEEIERALEEMS